MIKGKLMEDLMQEPSLDDLEALLQTGLQRNVLAIRCKLGKWLDSLPEEKRNKVQQLLDLEMSHAQITLLIQKVFDIKKDIVRQHRQGICRCRN
jgi:hypothetical protein